MSTEVIPHRPVSRQHTVTIFRPDQAMLGTYWQLNVFMITASSSWVVSGQVLLFSFLMCSIPRETLQVSSSFLLVSSFFNLLITFLSKSGSQFLSLHYKSLVFPKLPLYCSPISHLLHLCFLIFVIAGLIQTLTARTVKSDEHCGSDAGIRNETFPHTPPAVRQYSILASC